MNMKIEFLINKESSSMMWEPFWLPEQIAGLTLHINYPEHFQYHSYIMILDEKKQFRLQKLLGYGEQILGITDAPETTSIGGIPNRLGVGKWQIGLGIFTEYLNRYEGEVPIRVSIEITDNLIPITEPIGEKCWTRDGKEFQIDPLSYDWDRKFMKDFRWYKGDFHTHTRLSDGKETVKNAMIKAVQSNLDFYVPTEHNVLHTGWPQSSIMIVPGIEITTTQGHFNLFGVTKRPQYLYEAMCHMDDGEALDRYILQIVEQSNQEGWLVSINHPFLHIWKWKCKELPLEKIQSIEIINDPTYPYAKEANDRAIRFLDFLWDDGHRICGVGGSDAHNLIHERYEGADLPSVAGDPGTYVYCKSLTPRQLLEGVRKCNVCITRFCQMEINLQSNQPHLGQFLPGDELEAGSYQLELQLSGLKEEPVVFLISGGEGVTTSDRKTVLETTVESEDCFRSNVSIEVEDAGWQWFRIEVRNQQGDFLAYSNPFYHGEKSSRLIYFEDALQQMEREDGN